MGDILIPKRTGSEDVWDRLGGRARYCYDMPVVTAVSPGGSGHCGGLELDIADDFKNRFPLSLEFFRLSTESKLFNSTFADGTTSAGSRYGIQLGFGHLTLKGSLFGNSGDNTAGYSTGPIPMIGVGPASSSPADRSLGGDTFSFGSSEESRALSVSTRYVLLGEWRPSGRGPAFYIGPEFVYGTQYAGEGSPFNRLNLDLRLTVGLGFSDASVRGNNGGDRELGGVAISQALYASFHSALMRYTMAKTLSDPQGELGGGSSFGGERGPFVNVSVLLATSSTISALSSPLAPALHSGEDWFWVFAGANALVGATSFAYDSPSAAAAGTADMLNLARLIAYVPAEIGTVSKRRSLGSSEAEKREAYINLAAAVLNSVVTVAGAEEGSDAAAHGGVSAYASIAGSPNPTGGKLVERTDYSVIPYSSVSGSQEGNRAGFRVHRSWHDLPSRNIQLFSSVALLSPQLLGGNMGNHVSQSESYSSDSQLNTDLDATIGLEWKTPFTRLSLGLDNKAIYGGSETAKAGIGVAAGFDVLIPFNRHKGRDDGSGVTLGVRATAHKIFPEGKQTEIYPHIGITVASF